MRRVDYLMTGGMRPMLDLIVWLIKLPFVMLGWIVMAAFWFIGVILLVVGAVLTPVLGIGLLILPFGFLFLLVAKLIRKLL